MLSTLKKLCQLDGISSMEDNVRDFIISQVKPYADELKVDDLGNLIAFKKGKKHSPKLMVSAHMDEVGFVVIHIEEDGYLKFAPVGGIDPRVCLGRTVFIGKNKVPGIIGLKAIHIVKPEERKIVPKFRQMYIDIGAPDKAAALKLVDLGDPIVFDSDFVEFGDGMIKAKAIDDRFGCAIMIDLIKEDLPIDVTFVFTVQEEVGLRGARGAAYRIHPDISLNFEGSASADISTVKGHKKVSRLGNGPLVYLKDTRPVYDKALFDKINEIAKENGIPAPTKMIGSGGTDSNAIQLSREGVRVACLAAPVRYLHAPSCVAKKKDLINVEKLGRLFIEAVAAGKVGK
jgi:endoglucanase